MESKGEEEEGDPKSESRRFFAEREGGRKGGDGKGKGGREVDDGREGGAKEGERGRPRSLGNGVSLLSLVLEMLFFRYSRLEPVDG